MKERGFLARQERSGDEYDDSDVCASKSSSSLEQPRSPALARSLS